MVEVEDVTNSSNEPSSSQNSSSNTNSTNQPNSSRLMIFISNDKISFVLYLTRLFSIACIFAFLVPLFGYDQNTLYQKAILASAAISALKLHQRLQNERFQLSREYFSKIIVEDSFHYLLYSLIFLNTSPITVVLVPIASFSIMHVSTYSQKLLGVLGMSSIGFVRKAIDLVIAKQRDIMLFVAINEILLAPTIIVMIFMGKCGLMVPFIYYRFICMRYQSRRNPYSREIFAQLRLAINMYTNNANCPQFVKNLANNMINLVNRLAPQ
ncbi:transmembrane 33-like [Brachionus plicatilis]|uniref:Transmembrane 33-like n=1 Tax=Brachionus plicatilis TaxID=10195 RepID=A0A3M7R4Y7_BRAPC|nr:transmembrane 33-like [Brachionus plicatilis]